MSTGGRSACGFSIQNPSTHSTHRPHAGGADRRGRTDSQLRHGFVLASGWGGSRAGKWGRWQRGLRRRFWFAGGRVGPVTGVREWLGEHRSGMIMSIGRGVWPDGPVPNLHRTPLRSPPLASHPDRRRGTALAVSYALTDRGKALLPLSNRSRSGRREHLIETRPNAPVHPSASADPDELQRLDGPLGIAPPSA